MTPRLWPASTRTGPQTPGPAPVSTSPSTPSVTGDNVADRAGAVRPRAKGRLFAAAAAALLLPLAPPGCSEKDSGRKYRQLEGTITSIDLPNAQVTLRFFSEKHRTETTVTGKVTAETEIFINGALSSLEDLREGERVLVRGWVRGRGADREVVAERVVVERADTIRRGPAGQPTETDDQPAVPTDEPAPAGDAAGAVGDAAGATGDDSPAHP